MTHEERQKLKETVDRAKAVKSLTTTVTTDDLLSLLASHDALEKRVRELEGALGWYASEEPYRNAECDRLISEGGFFPYGPAEWAIVEDKGTRARQALAREEA